MNISDLTEKDWDYLTSCLKNGVDIQQAFAQLEVLKHEHEFKQALINAMHHPDVIREIQRIIEGIESNG